MLEKSRANRSRGDGREVFLNAPRDETVAYQTKQKGAAFMGHEVSLNSVSDLAVQLALTPGMEIRRTLA